MLANRFWGDKDDPRTHLRQAVASLREVFEEFVVESDAIQTMPYCFVVDRDTIQAVPGNFVTDIEEIMRLYAEAQTATTAEERLDKLIQAEGRIAGGFLEECIDPSNEGANWHAGVVSLVETKIALVLLALVEAHRSEGNLNGAFDTALRLLVLCPTQREGKRLAWELAAKTGQENAIHTLKAAQEYRTVLPRIAQMDRSGRSLTSQDSRLFETLLHERLGALEGSLKEQLFSLAVFPAPFSSVLAKAVCQVPHSGLTTMVEAGLLEHNEERYTLLRPVRAYAWRQVSSSKKQTLKSRHQKACVEWTEKHWQGVRHKSSCFSSVEEAKPHLEAVLEEWLPGSFSQKTLDFVTCLYCLGRKDLLLPHLPRLQNVAREEATDLSLRLSLARLVGKIVLDAGRFHEADAWFDLCLTFVSRENRFDYNHLLFLKANSAHYGGDSETAVRCLQEIIGHGVPEEGIALLAGPHRFLCEVLHKLGEYEEALIHADKAHAIYLSTGAGPAALADALFWQGKTLLKLGREEDADACIHKALELWLHVGLKTGVGHCLRVLAGLLMTKSNYAQAQANLEYAILLHQQVGSEGCRIAAVEVLAELRFRQGHQDEYRLHLQECLTYYEQQGRSEKAAQFRTLLAQCALT